LRVNLLAQDRETVQKILAADGVETEPTPFCPWGLRVKGKAFLSATKAFGKGHVEIQDEGSQLIALLCQAQPGMNVLDYCAGAGGKTLALTNMMQVNKRPKGRIVAMDLDAGRLEKARPRFRRAHVHDIIEIRPLSDEKARKWLKRQKQTFDITLVDAPCSGTGTWRRNPDTRWRRFGPALDDLLQTQAEILDRVATTVKPGGRLVYATCSLLKAENEDQIDRFLRDHPEFTIQPVGAILPAVAGSDGRFMRLSPHRHNTDGFFAATLTRS
jgi:16S rRNA (cytosine967-C5)-methyltransferase